MKYQGKVVNWNDDRGFGFVEPNEGGQRAFVHIKSYKSRYRRPIDGDVINYELTQDKNNRFQAVNISFAKSLDSAKKRSKSNKASSFGYFIILSLCIAIGVSTLLGNLPMMLVGVYVFMSLITFIAYALDKSAAQNDRWRTKENTLHLLSLIGGWPGAYFAQDKLHHKSSKRNFKIIYWITVLLNIGFIIWLHTNEGQVILNKVMDSFSLF